VEVFAHLRQKYQYHNTQPKMAEEEPDAREAETAETQPSGATTTATTFDERFESILHLEREFTDEGFQTGKRDGEIKGQREGESIGFLEGFAVGSEIGHYLGALRVWEARVLMDGGGDGDDGDDDERSASASMDERKRERIRAALRQLETAVRDIASGFDEETEKDETEDETTEGNLDEDFTEKLERARACFRKCTASLGMHGKYKGFAEEERKAEEGGGGAASEDIF
jgi:hypothetical protein